MHKKIITVDVYNCPGCGEEVLFSVTKQEGKLCPTCENIRRKELTVSYWYWMRGCKIIGFYVGDYSPREIEYIILELPDGSYRRIYPSGYPRGMEYSSWDESMGMTEWELGEESA